MLITVQSLGRSLCCLIETSVEARASAAVVIYMMVVVVGEGVNVIIWTAAFIQSRHGHKHRLVEGICFL